MNQNGFESDEQEQYYLEIERQRQEEDYYMEQQAIKEHAMEQQMKSGYLIEAHKESGRFIVWRLTEDKKLRQGSYDTYEKAFERMSQSQALVALCKFRFM